ncbi:hypothetical protein B7486_58690, partial [cyanobacterium TDX16]
QHPGEEPHHQRQRITKRPGVHPWIFPDEPPASGDRRRATSRRTRRRRAKGPSSARALGTSAAGTKRAERPRGMGHLSLVAGLTCGDDGVVILTRHGGRLRLEAWADHLEQHEVTRAPHRVDGKVIWLAPWAGIFDPGYTQPEVPTETSGLWAALASAVGSGATADS